MDWPSIEKVSGRKIVEKISLMDWKRVEEVSRKTQILSLKPDGLVKYQWGTWFIKSGIKMHKKVIFQSDEAWSVCKHDIINIKHLP